MIKPIITNPITRKFVATAILTTSVLATSAATIQEGKNKTTQTAQSELVGTDAAKAAMTNAVKIETFSLEHNKKLDDIYLKNCLPDMSKKDKKSNLDAIYRVYGTYGATIEIQRAIDSQFMENTINSFLNHYALSDDQRDLAKVVTSHFYGWQDQVLFTDLFRDELKMYDEQEFPSAEKAIAYVDNHINNTDFFTEADKKVYEEHSKIFKSKQPNKNSSQALSDLLAYKVHLLNILAINNYFSLKYQIPQRELFMAYFIKDFVNGDASIRPENSSK